MRENATYRAALYMRLSRDDDGAGESASIATQNHPFQGWFFAVCRPSAS